MTSARPLLSLFGAILGILSIAPVQAQNYPNRPITFIVPFAVGGLSDIPARVLAAEMQERIGQSIIVENRPGASGITGASFVARAEPDGYTLLVNALADVQNLHYLPVPYDAINDFALIGKITDGPPLVLIVNPNTPYKSVTDIIADAKANANKVSFGTSGPATTPAIAVSQLNALAGTNIVGVPYRGTGPAAVGVVTGEIQAAFVFYSNAKPLADDGKVRAIAITSGKRAPSWPDLPTLAEQGFAGFEHSGFVGLAAPGKTPARIIALLNKHLNEVINSESFRRRMEPLGMTSPTNNTPENFADFMRRETARQAELAKLSGHSVADPKR
jgi:tripartite-type tricarboxylate transporter receptor subunit TctC